MFLELGDKTQRGKERFAFFLYCAVSYFLIGIYVSDKTRNCCELGNILGWEIGIPLRLPFFFHLRHSAVFLS